MYLYNGRCNALTFNLSIYFCLTCFGLYFNPSSEAGVLLRQWFKSVGYSISTKRHGDLRSQIATHLATRHNTPIHNILPTAPQFSISQKALGTLPEDGNVMPKHVGAAIRN
jgi:hypothetical protein